MSYRTILAGTLAAICCAACGGDPAAPAAPAAPAGAPPTPPAADLRFKGVGTLAGTPTRVTNLLSTTTQRWTNQFATPLELSPCAAPRPDRTNCSWELVVLDEPVGTPDVSTLYNGAGTVSTLDADLAALARGTFVLPGMTSQDGTNVVTSLFVDEASDVYATSGLQTSAVRDFTLVPGTVAPSALQGAATAAGASGRVITAVAFRGGDVLYLSYGWTRDTTPVYEARAVATPFAGVAAAAASLAGEGYVITALGGDASRGYLLVGTRVRGATAARAVRVVTDSVSTPATYEFPALTLLKAGYAVVGGMLDGVRSGGGGPFNLYIGEK
jgi:hypothetical protein